MIDYNKIAYDQALIHFALIGEVPTDIITLLSKLDLWRLLFYTHNIKTPSELW